MKLAVTSIAFGKDYLRLAEVSFPTFDAYARKIGADFVPLSKRKFPTWSPYWEKLQLGDLLTFYDRVAFIDCDAIASPRAPSIFEAVPADSFGAVDEVAQGFVHRREMLTAVDFYGFHPRIASLRWHFNAGVMVFGRPHQGVFQIPSRVDPLSTMPEEIYFKLRVLALGIRFHSLPATWNAISQRFPKGRDGLNVIHYAGGKDQIDGMIAQMKRDLYRWAA
jgi:hypothetical protein